MTKNRYAFCFVFGDDGKVLVMRRSSTAKHRPGEWDLPGGLIKPDESPEDGVVREVFEETALAIQSPELIVRKSGLWHGEEYEYSYYRTDNTTNKILLSYEHDVYEWHEPLVASTMISYLPHKMALSISL